MNRRARDVNITQLRDRDALAFAVDLALVRAPNRDHDALVRDLTHGIALVRYLDCAADACLSCTGSSHFHAFERALYRTLYRAFNLILKRALAYARDFDRPFARAIVPALERAHTRGSDLECIFQSLTALEGASDDSNSGLERVERGLVALALRILPVRERPRYAEEFRVELEDLPRRERLRYALRVLTCAWELRRTLTEKARMPDGTLARRATEQ